MDRLRHIGTSWRNVMVGILVLFGLAGCSGCSSGGGGSSSGGGGGGGGTTPETYYLFYVAADGDLYAVDPATPTSPIPVASSVSGVQGIGHGTYTASNATVSNLHTRTIVYAKGGSIYKVSAVKGASAPPVPEQISSEAAATTICATTWSPNLPDHSKASYVYRVPNSGTDCTTPDDDVWKMVQLGTSNTTAPFTAPGEPIAPLDDFSTGKHIGWLVKENISGTDKLRCYNSNFTGGADIIDKDTGNPVSITQSVAYYGPANISQDFLRVNDAIGVYQITAPSASNFCSDSRNGWRSLIGVTPNSDGVYLSDTMRAHALNNLYYVNQTSPTEAHIYRYDLEPDPDAVTDLVVLKPTFSNNDVVSLHLTDTRLAFGWYEQPTNRSTVGTVPQGSGDGGITFSREVGGRLTTLTGNGSWVYYTIDQTPNSYTTIATIDDGSASATIDPSTSAWIGALKGNSYVVGSKPPVSRLFLLAPYDSGTGFAGDTITPYTASSGAAAGPVGAIPPTIRELTIQGHGTKALGLGSRLDGAYDVFYYDDSLSSSPWPVLVHATASATVQIIDAYR